MSGKPFAKVKVYASVSKETMWELGRKIGLTEEACQLFRHGCQEVELGLKVWKDGSVKITTVDGKKVWYPREKK